MSVERVGELLEGSDSSYRGLYYRWERERWEAGRIDLSEDRASWVSLARSQADPIEAAVAWRHLKASIAATALIPFVDAAPDEEQQVFLATQLADEARHLVFFDRVRVEVMGHAGLDPDRRIPPVTEPCMVELLARLEGAARALGASPRKDLFDRLVDGIVVHHLCTVGLLGQIQHRFLSAQLRKLGGYPGLVRGLELVARDSNRHVAFGLRFLEEAVRRHERSTSVIERALAEAYPETLAALGASVGEGSHHTADQLRAAARIALESWFEAVELDVAIPS